MIDVKYRLAFFDTKAVTSVTDKEKRKRLSKGGAFIRRTAKGSIRKRKGPSRPGTPPSSHTDLLRKLIFFAYDKQRDSVVVGPEKAAAKGIDAPRITEEGGRSTATSTRVIHKKGKRIVIKKGQKLSYPARPFMQPALDKEAKKAPELFKGILPG